MERRTWLCIGRPDYIITASLNLAFPLSAVCSILSTHSTILLTLSPAWLVTSCDSSTLMLYNWITDLHSQAANANNSGLLNMCMPQEGIKKVLPIQPSFLPFPHVYSYFPAPRPASFSLPT